MLGEKAEHWRDLCEEAAKEQDPAKFMELIQEINLLLQQKEERLAKQRSSAA